MMKEKMGGEDTGDRPVDLATVKIARDLHAMDEALAGEGDGVKRFEIKNHPELQNAIDEYRASVGKKPLA